MKPIEKKAYDLPEIVRKNVIYVDKTAYMHKLITDENHKLNLPPDGICCWY